MNSAGGWHWRTLVLILTEIAPFCERYLYPLFFCSGAYWYLEVLTLLLSDKINSYVPLEASQLTASQADIPQVCVFACTQNTPNLRCCFLKRRLTNTTRRHRLADGQLSSLYPPSPSFSPFGAASVMLCCSPPPASSSTPLRPSV